MTQGRLASASSSERAFFFPAGTERLFGILHAPARAPRGGVLMCHALAEEKLWSHRVYVSFARELARHGYVVLRFDFRGEGDSELEFEEATFSSRVEDGLVALDELERHLAVEMPVFVVGHRLGGSVALALARRVSGAGAPQVVVWDPIVDGEEYFRQLLRSNLATQMAVHGKVLRDREALVSDLLEGRTVVVDGYGLTGNLYREVCALKLADNDEVFERGCLLLEIARGGTEEGVSPRLRAISDAHPRVVCRAVKEPPFWRETREFHRVAPNLSAATLEWLESLAA